MIGRLLEKDLRELCDNPEFIKKILSYLKDDKDKEKMMEAIREGDVKDSAEAICVAIDIYKGDYE